MGGDVDQKKSKDGVLRYTEEISAAPKTEFIEEAEEIERVNEQVLRFFSIASSMFPEE